MKVDTSKQYSNISLHFQLNKMERATVSVCVYLLFKLSSLEFIMRGKLYVGGSCRFCLHPWAAKHSHCKQKGKLQITENNIQQVFHTKCVRVDLFWSSIKENSLRSEKFLILLLLLNSHRQRLDWFVNSVALLPNVLFFVWPERRVAS